MKKARIDWRLKSFVSAIFLLAIPVLAQEIAPSLLACQGTYSNSDAQIFDAAIKSGSIRLEKEAVFLTGFPGFDGRHRIVKKDPTSIAFEHLTDPKFKGGLNRLTGDYFLTMQIDADSRRLNQWSVGACKVSARLF
jgi:hypothetical protein